MGEKDAQITVTFKDAVLRSEGETVVDAMSKVCDLVGSVEGSVFYVNGHRADADCRLNDGDKVQRAHATKAA